MRILMVAHSDAPWTPHYARFFKQRGDSLLLVSFAPFELDGAEGIDMEFVGIEPFDKYKNKHMFITRAPRIRRIAKRFNPDLIFATYLASNGLSAALAWNGPAPLVVSGRGGDVLEQAGRTGLRRYLREMVIKYVCGKAQMVHSVSQEISDTLVKLSISKKKIIQIPIGVDPEQFRPPPDMPTPAANQLVTVRKHEPIYDNATTIKALAMLKERGRDFHCTFAGDGTLLEQHKAQAKQAGLDNFVTFTGHLTHDQLPALLHKAAIYISATYSDGTSSALLECLAAGLMPVVSRIPANTPWIKNGQTGLLFEPGQADQLTDALERAMDDKELRERARKENYIHLENGGNRQRNLERLAEAFEKLIAEQNN